MSGLFIPSGSAPVAFTAVPFPKADFEATADDVLALLAPVSFADAPIVPWTAAEEPARFEGLITVMEAPEEEVVALAGVEAPFAPEAEAAAAPEANAAAVAETPVRLLPSVVSNN